MYGKSMAKISLSQHIASHERIDLKLLQRETTLTQTLQSANLTTTIVWARFAYHYLTATNDMLLVNDHLQFCCKFTTN